MEPTSTEYLKLYQGPASPSPTVPGDDGALTEIESLCRAFSAATGIRLRYVASADIDFDANLEWSAPVNPGDGTSPGQLRMARSRNFQGHASAEAELAAREFLYGFADLITTKLQASTALVQREAELATMVPVVPHASESAQLVERLKAVLQGGAESLGCQAAGVYLLDDATSQLKLRSCWGLPESRLSMPARSLAGAIADLEALSGHAVVLENDMLFDSWQVPERCGAAVCVPISTPTTILGTLWLFSETARDFDAKETNLAEILAGRIATDLERDMLLREGVDSREAKQELSGAAEYVEETRPTATPLLDGWDIASCLQATGNDDTPASQIVDWRAVDDNSLDLVVASGGKPNLRSAMQAVALRATWRAEVDYENEPQQLLERLVTSCDEEFAEQPAMSLGNVHLEAGRRSIALASTEQMGVLVRRAGLFSWLDEPCQSIAAEAGSILGARHEVVLADDELLLLLANANLQGRRDEVLAGLQRIAAGVKANSARQLTEHLRSFLCRLDEGRTAEWGILAMRTR